MSPVASRRSGVGPDEHEAAERPRRTKPRRGCVLVVEDDPDDWEIYGKILWYNGFDVLYAPDGATACEHARFRPDLVLLDLMLPDVDGFELCRRLRAEPGMEHIPIVILSGRPASEFGAIALQSGCARYLEKPARPVDVLHMVESLIGRQEPAGVGAPPRKYPTGA